MMPRRRTVRRVVLSFAMGALLLAGTAFGLLRAQGSDPEVSIHWQTEVSPQATIAIDVPYGWEVVEPVEKGAPTRFVPLDGTHCQVLVQFALASDTRPPIAGTETLRTFVDAEAGEALDQAVESHYTLRELRGPETAGYYYALRDRTPRRKEAVFLQRGALLVRNAVIRFRIETPKPDLPAIRQALKMLAGSRFVVSAPAPDDSAVSPAVTRRSDGSGGGR
jgi:hypothetical protein